MGELDWPSRLLDEEELRWESASGAGGLAESVGIAEQLGDT
jgi:hypothetical protein